MGDGDKVVDESSIGTLRIEGDSVIYFISEDGDMGIPALYVESFEIYNDSVLTLNGDVGLVYIKDTAAIDAISRIRFSIYGEFRAPKWYIKNGYYMASFVGMTDPWTPPPVPEPSTYGAVVSVCLLGVGFWRKRKSRLKQSLKKLLGVRRCPSDMKTTHGL